VFPSRAAASLPNGTPPGRTRGRARTLSAMPETEDQIAALTSRVSALEQALQAVADLLEDIYTDQGNVAGMDKAGMALAPVRQLVAGS
jgi:hypothetical protein